MQKDEYFFASASLGYRGWRLDGGLLRPSFRTTGEPWDRGVTVAVCGRGSVKDSHQAPHPECKCGLHAYHELERLSESMRMQERMEVHGHRGTCEIVGAVAARGDLRIHHEGWRAEEAQILGLLVIGVESAPAWRLTASANAGEIYGVPLFTEAADLIAHAERHAEQVPVGCRPPAPSGPSYEERAAQAIERSRRIEETRAADAEAMERARRFFDGSPINGDVDPLWSEKTPARVSGRQDDRDGPVGTAPPPTP